MDEVQGLRSARRESDRDSAAVLDIPADDRQLLFDGMSAVAFALDDDFNEAVVAVIGDQSHRLALAAISDANTVRAPDSSASRWRSSAPRSLASITV